MSSVNLAAVETYLLGLQQNIVSALEVAGNQSFLRDEWIRTEGGGGISRHSPRLQPRIALKLPGVCGRPWAYRWSCIRAIHTFQRHI